MRLRATLQMQGRPLWNTGGNFTRWKTGGESRRSNGRERLVSVCWTSLQTRTRNKEAPRRNRHQLGPRKAAQNCARLRYKLFRSNRLKGKRPQKIWFSGRCPSRSSWVLPGSWVGAHLDHRVQGGSLNVAFVANLGWLTTTWAADLGSEDTTRPGET